MQVLFLALGASRKRAVLDESAELRASGAQVIVVVDKKKSWLSQEFAPGVVVTTLKELEARHLPRRMEHALLYRVPRATVRAVGRGPLRGRARRGLKAYERGLAAKLHRKVFVPAHRRLWPDAQARMVLAPFAARGDWIFWSSAMPCPSLAPCGCWTHGQPTASSRESATAWTTTYRPAPSRRGLPPHRDNDEEP